VTEAELILTFPRLWHMAEDGSWPSIRANGLLSTAALLKLYGVTGEQRAQILTRRRPASVTISRDGLPDAVIRDQKPMSHTALSQCLVGQVTPSQWYEILNAEVFFWVTEDRVDRLLGAKAYRSSAHTVLTLDTESLVAAHRERILLSPINSGSTIMKPQPRGTDTFRSIAEYPFAGWRKRRRSAKKAVAELVVRNAVPDVLKHLISVHRVSNGHREELWCR
jgi:hypothetical protein